MAIYLNSFMKKFKPMIFMVDTSLTPPAYGDSFRLHFFNTAFNGGAYDFKIVWNDGEKVTQHVGNGLSITPIDFIAPSPGIHKVELYGYLKEFNAQNYNPSTPNKSITEILQFGDVAFKRFYPFTDSVIDILPPLKCVGFYFQT